MNHDQDKCSSASPSAGAVVTPQSVLKHINDSIDGHNRAIARLVALKDRLPIEVAGMSIRDVAEILHS